MTVFWTSTAEEHLDAIYYIKPDGIDVLAVIHAAQDSLNQNQG